MYMYKNPNKLFYNMI